VLLLNRQGKVRLTKWYSAFAQKDRKKAIREITNKYARGAPALELARTHSLSTSISMQNPRSSRSLV